MDNKNKLSELKKHLSEKLEGRVEKREKRVKLAKELSKKQKL
jgi:hypothetical protein